MFYESSKRKISMKCFPNLFDHRTILFFKTPISNLRNSNAPWTNSLETVWSSPLAFVSLPFSMLANPQKKPHCCSNSWLCQSEMELGEESPSWWTIPAHCTQHRPQCGFLICCSPGRTSVVIYMCLIYKNGPEKKMSAVDFGGGNKLKDKKWIGGGGDIKMGWGRS